LHIDQQVPFQDVFAFFVLLGLIICAVLIVSERDMRTEGRCEGGLIILRISTPRWYHICSSRYLGRYGSQWSLGGHSVHPQ
jgi:hypothetical protein